LIVTASTIIAPLTSTVFPRIAPLQLLIVCSFCSFAQALVQLPAQQLIPILAAFKLTTIQPATEPGYSLHRFLE
jgi:hypothetical protein